MNVMLAEERTITPAAVHQFRGHLTAQLGVCLFNDARQPFDSVQLRRFGRQLVHINDPRTPFSLLDSQKIIPSHRSDEQGGFKAGVLSVGSVLDEIENLLWRRAELDEELSLLRIKKRFRVLPSGSICRQGILEQLPKSFRPVVIVHGWNRTQIRQISKLPLLAWP